MDFLRRHLAPLIDEAWSMVDAEAERVLRARLVGRRVVDVDGPRGFDFSAVNLGRVAVAEDHVEDGVRFGVRRVLPLTELRVPFDMGIWALDDLARGAADVDTGPIVQAALRLAAFEDRAVMSGFAPGGVSGLAHAAVLGPSLGKEPNSVLDALTRARLTLEAAGVGGPFAAVLSESPFRTLASATPGQSPLTRAAEILGGPILESAVVDGGLVLSLRGGDFVLTIGQDAAIGYEWHDKGTVRLFLTESMTFRALTPDAVVRLNP